MWAKISSTYPLLCVLTLECYLEVRRIKKYGPIIWKFSWIISHWSQMRHFFLLIKARTWRTKFAGMYSGYIAVPDAEHLTYLILNHIWRRAARYWITPRPGFTTILVRGTAPTFKSNHMHLRCMLDAIESLLCTSMTEIYAKEQGSCSPTA